MKTTMIVNKALAPRLDADIDRLCRTGKFSLMTDESNDQGGEKVLVILARLFDPVIGKTATRFVNIPLCNIGNAENIFDAINTCFRYEVPHYSPSLYLTSSI